MNGAGKATNTQIQQSSGVAPLDAMVVTAIQKASPLPLDHGKLMPSISLAISNPAP